MWLKQSTAITVMIGPFLDSTDGNTVEGALAIAQADVRLSKNGGNMAQKNDANACVHDELGHYSCQLNGTDTNTLGRLKLMIHEAGALAVWHEYMVVSANTWDSFFAAENLDVNAVEISGDSGAADNAEAFFDGTGYAGTNNVIPTVTTLTGHTAQTGDNFARIGAPVGASISADIADVPTVAEMNARTLVAASYFDPAADAVANVTLVATTTDVTNRVTANTDQIEGADATDQINAACDASIETYNLDHLLAVACAGNVITGAVVDNSVMAILAAIGGDISDYADASDSQEALADAIAAISITADLIWDEEMGVNAPGACNTAREYMNVILAALAGKTAGTGDWSARDLGDTKTRIQGTLSDSGARSSVDTLDGI